ncbi:calpain-A isoform X2 [Folsomia candida]|uniref:calpain-A isoform X2 n=1 Tax=Folsomia candida TaxID=158441 RepID=UPI000B9018FD|nr:calpain-A isoform X2 [Folsomia candida]
MAFKGFFKTIKDEVKNEIGRQIDRTVNKKGGGVEDGENGENSGKVDMSLIEGVLGLLGGGGGSGKSGLENLGNIINAIQGQTGGFLPGSVGKYLPGILKVAEIIGHGMGDDTPRNEQNADGSFVDNFIKTIVGGRKIHGGKSSFKVKPVERGADNLFHSPLRTGRHGEPRGAEAVQDYEKLKSKCLERGVLFEDSEFPAEDASVFFTRSGRRNFQWLRPHEICSDPKFFVEGATRFDVKQGELGDCWLLAAVANLTLNPALFHQIVPEDNSFINDYAGIFHFRFWQYGRWVDVVVDDRLPTFGGKLMFMHSEERNEMWSALFEKAYAKLHGSYEALKGGTTCEALEDFTGGVTEMYDIRTAPKNLFQMILKAYERSSFLGCSIEPDPNVVEAETPMGLIRGHAYSITDVKLVDIETPRVKGKIPLLRIRNPWGNEAEWKGAWSDGSPEWSYINDDTKEEIGLTFDADGEFWMSFKDFQTYFDRLEICNLSPDDLAVDDLPGKKKWNMNVYEGAWIRGATAGGCRNYLETFAHNPQYIIDLEDPDEDDDESKCTVIVALMQKNRRAQRKLGMDCLTIGFAIYSLTGDNIQSPLPVKFFKYNASIARSPTFINLREVCSRFKLDPGKYVVVPSTFEPNEEGEFIIRVFSEGPNSMTENDSDVGIGEIDDKVKETEPEEAEAAERVQQFFKTVAGDDMGIDWSELKEVLDLALKREFAFEGFSREVCRSMVAMMDIDRSGKLGLDEFVSLWKSIRTWKSVFKIYDHDNSGHLSSFELRQALTSAGYHVNNKVLESLVLRYGDPQGQVMFDDFIMCAVKLKCMIEIYREKEVAGDRSVNFTLEEWVEKTLYS